MRVLEDKIAIITGAASGIGAATAVAFARHGARSVVIADLDEEKAAATCATLENTTGCRCIPVRTDVSSNVDIETLFDRTMQEFGALDVLVNCAGVCPVGTIEEIDAAHWDRVMDVNLRGTYLCCRKALGIMKPRRCGKIINISSISGRIGGIATGINYAVSKGGIITMTMSLAKAAGSFNINVNAVAPGFINTDMTKDFTHFDPQTVPLRRIGEPEDVADIILFLASDLSRYITGCTIDVNGGVYMQ